MAYLDLAEGLVKQLENCKLVGYADTGGLPTIGWGHRGPQIYIGEQITQKLADTWLHDDLSTADYRLRRVCKPAALAALKDHQHAALVSFVFNVGAGSSWAIWKDINSGNLADVPAQLRRFDKGEVNGKMVTIKGLDARREAEIAFWNTADEAAVALLARPEGPGSGVDQAPPSATTVAMPTPPTPQPAPPLAKVSLWAKLTTLIGGATATVGTQAQQIHGIISPYIENHKIFNTLDTVALSAVVGAGVVGLWVHHHQAVARTT